MSGLSNDDAVYIRVSIREIETRIQVRCELNSEDAQILNSLRKMLKDKINA